MSIESTAAKVFRMSDAVWERHTNPWSVWTRFPCLPLLSLAIWSRVWFGWLSLLPIALVCVWIWLNPRVFRKPATTDHWASKAVLGEQLLLQRPKSDIPAHHLRATKVINLITFAGFVLAVYGLSVFDVELVIFGVLITTVGKMWFLDRMVWLHQDLSSGVKL